MDSSSRRSFLVDGSLAVIGAAAGRRPGRGLRIGLVADVHYADADPKGTRCYRDSIAKMREAVDTFNREGVDLVVELGDLVDTAPDRSLQRESGYLVAIEAELGRARAPRHHVLGNHCVTSWSKARFLNLEHQRRAEYSFDAGGLHVVILDGCYRRDGMPYDTGEFEWTDTDIPGAQREWLGQDLAATRLRAVVFVHQRLDLPPGDEFAIHSSAEVRTILERSGRVAAVVMGHSHRNDYREIGGIPYITLSAMVDGPGVDNGAFSILAMEPAGRVRFNGFRAHKTHPLAK